MKGWKKVIEITCFHIDLLIFTIIPYCKNELFVLDS